MSKNITDLYITFVKGKKIKEKNLHLPGPFN